MVNPVVTVVDTLGGSGGVASVNSGTDITVDNTDPANPIINYTGTPGGLDVKEAGVSIVPAATALDFLSLTVLDGGSNTAQVLLPTAVPGLHVGTIINVPPADGNTLAFYKFDTGALTTDSSGNSYTLTSVGTVGQVADTATTAYYDQQLDAAAAVTDRLTRTATYITDVVASKQIGVYLRVDLPASINNGEIIVLAQHTTSDGTGGVKIGGFELGVVFSIILTKNGGNTQLTCLISTEAADVLPVQAAENVNALMGTQTWIYVSADYGVTTAATTTLTGSISNTSTTIPITPATSASDKMVDWTNTQVLEIHGTDNGVLSHFGDLGLTPVGCTALLDHLLIRDVLETTPYVFDQDFFGQGVGTNYASFNSAGAEITVPLIVGDPGFEASGITVNSSLYTSSLKVSDIGGSNVAQTILHRHSTTLEPLIVGARSNSDDATHVAVTNGQRLLTMYATGYAGSTADYQIFGSQTFSVEASGTVSDTSSPGRFEIALTPDGSATPVTAFSIASNKAAVFEGSVCAHQVDDGTKGATATIDWKAGNNHVVLLSTGAAPCVFTFTAPVSYAHLTIKLTQDAGGNFTVTWPAEVKWPGGTPPTLSVAAGAIDVITLYYDGSTYFGSYGLAYA